MRFDEIGLSEEMVRAAEKLGFTEMTEIQEKSIPVILEGRDVIGRSNTGTGKTAAFGMPAVERIKREGTDGVQTLILCPTRELSIQAADELKKFACFMPWVKVSAVYGGADMLTQLNELKNGANIVVGTPGRVMDHIRRKNMKLSSLETIILDEADEMLDMGFREDIEEILGYVPEKRQTLLFSATMPEAIMEITENYQDSPVIVKADSDSLTVEAIEQSYYIVGKEDKQDALYALWLYHSPKTSMVFCNTKKMVDELTEFLVLNGIRAEGIHGDMKQLQRTSVMNSFKKGRISVLVATDVAARGIDVNGIDAVFNYDFPLDDEYYIHRIGRTGRAGKFGKAFTLINGTKQVSMIKALARFLKTDIKELSIPGRDEIVDARLEEYAEKVVGYCKKDIIPETYRLFEILMEKGVSYEDAAIALCSKNISKYLKNVPEVQTEIIKPVKHSRWTGNGKNIKLNISIGRRDKVAPRYILNALTEATGMTGKDFSNIRIYDSYTTVDVPESECGYVIESMKSCRINGNKISVKPYDPRDVRSYNRKGTRRNVPQKE